MVSGVLAITVSWISTFAATVASTDAAVRLSATGLVMVRYTAPLTAPAAVVRAHWPVTVTEADAEVPTVDLESLPHDAATNPRIESAQAVSASRPRCV